MSEPIGAEPVPAGVARAGGPADPRSGLSSGASLPPSSATPNLSGGIDPATPRALLPLAHAMAFANRVLVALGMLALLAASLVLTSSVVTRYLFKASTDWQDETAVFLLVGATFLSGAFVQSIRGHVGIEAVATLLSRRADAARRAFVDLLCLGFCTLFAWKSWTLLHEAFSEGQTTASSWAPPLWIPYLLMSLGMTLLAVQLLVHLAASCNRLRLVASSPAGARH